MNIICQIVFFIRLLFECRKSKESLNSVSLTLRKYFKYFKIIMYIIILSPWSYMRTKVWKRYISNHGTEILPLMIKYYIILSLFIHPIKIQHLAVFKWKFRKSFESYCEKEKLSLFYYLKAKERNQKENLYYRLFLFRCV